MLNTTDDWTREDTDLTMIITKTYNLVIYISHSIIYFQNSEEKEK